MFYIVSDEYIDYLLKFDSHVLKNKKEERTYHRKYVGILTKVNGFDYFVPMSSPKEKDFQNGRIRKDSLTTIYMKHKEKLYGTLRFNCMIPVPQSQLTCYSINDEGDFSYKMLMLAEYNFCKTNNDKIHKTAQNLYKKKKSNQTENSLSMLKVTVDFSVLENACTKFV